MCIFKGCTKTASFNYDGEKKSLYCKFHRLEGMINIRHEKCQYEGCKTVPSFNHESETKRLFCFEHKLDGMINITNKFCKYEGCKKYQTFNYKGYITGLYCGKHRLDGMIDVKSKKCANENCDKYPIFNFEKEPKAKFCFDHKLDGMLDVKNKKCVYPDCKVRAHYNYKGETTILYCGSHRLEGMLDIKSKRCKTYLCSTIVKKSSRYDGYCLFCFMNLFPDKPVSRNYKTKEYSVVEYVKTNFSHLTWISDKTIQDGCSKRRPDLFLDLGYQIIILEIDENQHIDYDCSCENKLIMELSQDVGHRPIIFIRFNPDEYTNKENKISSCWGVNQNGICVVKKTKKKEWDERLETLKEQINYWINPVNKTDKTIEVVQLFYDR